MAPRCRPAVCSVERSHEGDDIIGFGPPGPEVQVGCHRRVPSWASRWHTRSSWVEIPLPSWITTTPGAGRSPAGGPRSTEDRCPSWPRSCHDALDLGPAHFRPGARPCPAESCPPNLTLVPTSLDLGSQARPSPEPSPSSWGAAGSHSPTGRSTPPPTASPDSCGPGASPPADHVAFLMENNIRYLELAWGAQRSGLYYTALNNHLRSGEVQYILDDCGATALVTTPAMAEVVSLLDLSRSPDPTGGGRDLEGFDDYESSRLSLRPDAGRRRIRRTGDVVLVGHHRPTQGCPQDLAGHGLSATPRPPPSRSPWVWPPPASVPDRSISRRRPLYHSAPLVYSMSMLRLGATVVIMENFDAATCLELIERHRVTHAQFVPTMFVRMLKLPPRAEPLRPLQPRATPSTPPHPVPST
jgi:hypothetical protein